MASTEVTQQRGAVSENRVGDSSVTKEIASVSESKIIEMHGGLPAALEIARYLIRLAAGEAEPEFLTHMRLHKLLYYVQGWSLAIRNRPAFFERIEAWAHGPVVREVYPRFAAFENKPIELTGMPQSQGLLQEDPEFIESVWEAYKGYSVTSLRAMTHKERPWKDARADCGPADRCDTEITREAMQAFFRKAAGSDE